MELGLIETGNARSLPIQREMHGVRDVQESLRDVFGFEERHISVLRSRPGDDFQVMMKGHKARRIQLVEVSSNSEVRDVSVLSQSLQVTMPLCGRLTSRRGSKRTEVISGAAIITAPQETVDLDWSMDSRAIVLRVDQSLINCYLMDYFGDQPKSPLAFEDCSISLSAPGCASWAVLLNALSLELGLENSFLLQGVTEREWGDLLVSTLLNLAANSLMSTRRGSGEKGKPVYVRRAVDYMMEHLRSEVRRADLVAACGVPMRTLHDGFKRSYGVGPMKFFQNARLLRVRDELLSSDPLATKVGDVGGNWGFDHCSSFAAVYREMFGELPSQTLRRT
jgi:AraC-like DNA-binding protein